MSDSENPLVAGRSIGAAPPPEPTGSLLFAALWMMGALSSFALMAVAGREVSHELDTFQLMFYRSLFGVIIIVAIGAVLPGGLSRFKTQRLGMHFSRNVLHFVGQFCWFYAIALITLAEVFALEFTTPIWVALLAPLFLSERMTVGRGVAVVLGFAGVMIVLRPGITTLEAGHIAMLSGAVGFAFSFMLTKKLSRTERPLTILFWMALMQAPMGLIGSLGDVVLPGPMLAVWLVLVTVCGLSAHFCTAQAFRWADATTVAPIDFFRLPLIAVVGMVLYAEPLDPFVFIGGAGILTGNWFNIWYEHRKR